MTAAPRFSNQWDVLLDVARELRAARAAGDPGQVAKGRLTQAEADDRARLSCALVTMWTHIVERTVFDHLDSYASLGASWYAIRRDLAGAVDRAAARAARAPADLALRDFADCVRALLWQMQPTGSTDLPHILWVHGFNAMLATRRAAHARKAA